MHHISTYSSHSLLYIFTEFIDILRTYSKVALSESHIQIYTSVCMCVYVCVCVYLCMYVYIYVCRYVCMYIYVYVCMYACVYVCMIIYRLIQEESSLLWEIIGNSRQNSSYEHRFDFERLRSYGHFLISVHALIGTAFTEPAGGCWLTVCIASITFAS